MQKSSDNTVDAVRQRLIEVSARTTQDLGLGRIVGQVMAAIYLTEQECSLEEIADSLGLSKAAVSIAARRLESLELIRRTWRSGDRRSYYRIADNFRIALQRGLMAMITSKIRTIGEELDMAGDLLQTVRGEGREAEVAFLGRRVERARKMKDRAMKILDSPIVKFLGR